MENHGFLPSTRVWRQTLWAICSPLMAVQSHRCVKLSCHMRKNWTGESIKRRHKRGYGIMSSDNKVNVDVKLGVNKFYVDEGHPHIILRSSPDMQEFNKLIKACPAGLYKLDDAGNIHFDSAGCLECGTCRVLCGNTLLENGNTRRERSALSFATADALKHRITTLRRLIRLAPGDYVICINREQVNECYINV